MDHCCSSLLAVARVARLLIFIRNYFEYLAGTPSWLYDSPPMRRALARQDIPLFSVIFRASSGMSQHDLAAVTGWSQSTISCIESGRRRPLDVTRKFLRFTDAIGMPRVALLPFLLGRADVTLADIGFPEGTGTDVDRRSFGGLRRGGPQRLSCCRRSLSRPGRAARTSGICRPAWTACTARTRRLAARACFIRRFSSGSAPAGCWMRRTIPRRQGVISWWLPGTWRCAPAGLRSTRAMLRWPASSSPRHGCWRAVPGTPFSPRTRWRSCLVTRLGWLGCTGTGVWLARPGDPPERACGWPARRPTRRDTSGRRACM